MVIDQLKSVELNTTTKLNQTGCIALNVIQSLQSVICLNRKLKMIFDTEVNSAHTYQQWINSQVQFINGGKEWNCTNATTGQAILIMMKLIPTTFKLTKNEITVDVTNDTNITPLVCFDNITIQMTTEQESTSQNNSTKNNTNSTTTNTQRTTIATTLLTTTMPVMEKTSLLTNLTKITTTTTTTVKNNLQLTAKSCLFSSYDSNTVYIQQQPLSVYKPGQQIYVRWSLNSAFDTSIVLGITLKRTSWTGIATNIYTWNVPSKQYYAYLTIPSTMTISTVNNYFVDFSWWNNYYCTPIYHSQSTNIFQIPTAPSIVVDSSSPQYHSTYYPGDTVIIRWTVQTATFPSNIQVKLRFNRFRSILDEKIEYVLVWPSTGSYRYVISTNLNKQANTDEYYFRLDWSDCPWISLTDTSTSDTQRFYVPTSPFLTPILPSTGDRFSLSDIVKITWSAKNFDSTANSNFVVKLKRFRALMWDETIYSIASCGSPSLGVCYDKLSSPVEPSISDFYYEFNWCGWYPFSCSIYGNYFQIPVHQTGGWNYNSQRDSASAQLPLFHADCHSSPNGVVTQLCSENRSMSIDLTCTNCYMKYDYSVIRLDLIASGGVLGRMNVQLYSTTTINLELLLTSNYAYQKSDSKSLDSITLAGFSFSIFGISFDYGTFLDLELPYKFNLNAIGQISAGLQYQLNTNIQLVVNGTTSSYSKAVTLTKTNYPVSGDFKANLFIDIALKPTLRITAIIFSVGITTEGYLKFENNFQYPPFPSILSNTYDYNISNPSIYHWSYPSDACSAQHLLQYHIQFGIRNSYLTFDVNLLNNRLNSYISQYFQTHYQSPSFLDSPVYELVSGCLFKIPYDDYPQPANLYLDIPYDTSFSLSDYFKTSIIFDVSKVVNVDPTRILYNTAQSYYDQTRRKFVTLVQISLLPSVLSQISDPNVQSLANTLVNKEMTPSSILYTGTQLLKLLLNDLTQQSNINNSLITPGSNTFSTTSMSSTSANNQLTSNSTTTRNNSTTISTPIISCSIPSVSVNSTVVLLSLVNSSPFNYTYFRYSYRATSNRTKLTFAFRQDSSYWCLDDISVTMNNISYILNGGFETGSIVSYSLCTPFGLNSSGSVQTRCPHFGLYSYSDGGYQQSDYLSQTFSTVPQNVYEISFWLRNLGFTPNSVNVTVY